MGRYKCGVCGYVYDEEKEGKAFEEMEVCPVCRQPKAVFVKEKEAETKKKECTYRYMEEIQHMAATGEHIIEAMGTQMPMPGFDEVLVLGAQLNPPPLQAYEEVTIRTVIGKHAEKPMVLEGPVYVSHMSFGALSKEAKTALSEGTAMAKTAMCSGEGGILPEEKAGSL